MANKQPQLNGGYYGPSIPPVEQPRRHNHHRAGRCCCCLFGIFWKLLVAIIVIIVLAILIFWILVQPHGFKFNVTEAKLTQFNYTTTNNKNTLDYNLVLNFTARNPNKKLNIYYDKVECHAFYKDTRFGSTDVIIMGLNSFRQYTKSTDRMSGVLKGQRVMVLKVSDFETDKKNGVFDVDLKLYFTIRFRLGDYIAGDTKANAKCELKVPFASNGKTVTKFEPTKCHVNF